MHAFLVLKAEDGKVIAVGDLESVSRDDMVRERMVFHFRDGSLDDETTVFRQRSTLQLVSDRHIQRGPSYPDSSNIFIEARTGQVRSRTVKDGKEEVKTEHMDLPPDLANGMISAVVQNLPKDAAEVKVSYVGGDPKPRVVTLVITPRGKDTFRVAGEAREALVYNIHIELGGVAGVVAPLLGKQPSDTQIWVTAGEVHAFLKMKGALYEKGPIWTMEQTSAEWRR